MKFLSRRLSALGLLLVSALPAAANKWYADTDFKVHKKAPKGTVVIERGAERLPAATLRAALEAARDGDVIRLSAGRFDDVGPEANQETSGWPQDPWKAYCYPEKAYEFGEDSWGQTAALKADRLVIVGAGPGTYVLDTDTYKFTSGCGPWMKAPKPLRFDARGKDVTFADMTLVKARFLTDPRSSVWLLDVNRGFADDILPPIHSESGYDRRVADRMVGVRRAWDEGPQMRALREQMAASTRALAALPAATYASWPGRPRGEFDFRGYSPDGRSLGRWFGKQFEDGGAAFGRREGMKSDVAPLFAQAEADLARAGFGGEPEPLLALAETDLAAGRALSAAARAMRAWRTLRWKSMSRAEALMRRALAASELGIGVALTTSSFTSSWNGFQVDEYRVKDTWLNPRQAFEQVFRATLTRAFPGAAWLRPDAARKKLQLTMGRYELHSSRAQARVEIEIEEEYEDSALKDIAMQVIRAREDARDAEVRAALAGLNAAGSRLSSVSRKLAAGPISVDHQVHRYGGIEEHSTTITSHELRGGESAASAAAREAQLDAARRSAAAGNPPNYTFRRKVRKTVDAYAREFVQPVEAELSDESGAVVARSTGGVRFDWFYTDPYYSSQGPHALADQLISETVAAPLVHRYLNETLYPRVLKDIQTAARANDPARAAEAVLARAMIGGRLTEPERALLAEVLGDARADDLVVRAVQLLP